MRRAIFILAAVLPSLGFGESEGETLLQASRPDVKLRFRYCVPTTPEEEIAHDTDIEAYGSLSYALIKRIPDIPDKKKIEAELRNSEFRFWDDMKREFAKFTASLTLEDHLYRYAFDYGEKQEVGLLVVRAGKIRQKYLPETFPNLFPESKYSSEPKDPERLLYELKGLIKLTGIVAKGDTYLAIVDGKTYRKGMAISVTYYDREWKPVIEEIDGNSVSLSLAGASDRMSVPVRKSPE